MTRSSENNGIHGVRYNTLALLWRRVFFVRRNLKKYGGIWRNLWERGQWILSYWRNLDEFGEIYESVDNKFHLTAYYLSNLQSKNILFRQAIGIPHITCSIYSPNNILLQCPVSTAPVISSASSPAYGFKLWKFLLRIIEGFSLVPRESDWSVVRSSWEA